jgi:hypothetical protein
MVIMGIDVTDLSEVRENDVIGFETKDGYFNPGFILSLVYVDKTTGKIAGSEGNDFDISPEYLLDPSRYYRAWICK